MEIHHKVLKLFERNPNLTQRDLSNELGVSLGKINYCIQALVKKGLVKVQNFRNNENKSGYAYILTKKGIEEKAKLTIEFLKIKLKEYELIKKEIEDLEREVLLERKNAGG